MTVTMPVWTLVAALLATAGAGGWGTHLVHRRRRFDRWLTAQEQQAQKERGRWWATLDATLATVAPIPAADPEPAPVRAEAMVCAGTDLPARDIGIDPVITSDARRIVAMVDDGLDVEPTPDDDTDVPRDETRVTGLGARDDDTGGTPIVGAVAVDTIAYRYPWPAEAAPRQPWRAPVRMLHTAVVLTARRAVGRWQPASRWEAWCDRWRVTALATTARVAQAYRRTGRHADRVLHTRSWSEIADERSRQWAADAAERARQARRLILRAQAGMVRRPRAATAVAVPPMVGCTP